MTPITKSYSVFDCDAHINDHTFAMLEWPKYFSASERELGKDWYWHFGDYALLNGRVTHARPTSKWYAAVGLRTPHGTNRPSFVDIQGPGINKKIIRKLNHSALTDEQLEAVAHRGS